MTLSSGQNNSFQWVQVSEIQVLENTKKGFLDISIYVWHFKFCLPV